MHFCEVCENMFYIKLNEDDSNNILYYCKNCGNENNTLAKDNICVSSVNYRESSQNFNYIVNEYTKLDPTLPRINNISCPNNECASNSNGENKAKNEIIYLRYNDKDMKYIYMCANCDYVWKTDNK